MRHALACLVVTAAAIAGVWIWLGSPALLMSSQISPGQKLYCVSYTPFRGGQTPLDPATMIPAAQIEDDLTRLSAVTDCIRTYSVDFGLDQIAGIAARHSLKVMQGLWLSSNPEKSHYQIETAVVLANKYPGTIRSIVVGNEVLLRGDMTATDLTNTIRAIKARVQVPVTYADVWEFWLRNRDVANAVDFITIHILPYWEDFPIAASASVAHVESICRQVVAAFPGKEVLIGEVGWPSAGRMREGALPSPVNQARVVQDVLALSKREKFNVNIIEAFDQPWKRALEGTVGGHWGLFDAATRAPKFAGAQAVSNHPLWIWQGAGGIIFAVIVFVAAMTVRTKDTSPWLWLAVSANAFVGGVLIGWTVENIPIESLGVGGWSRSLALAAVAIAGANRPQRCNDVRHPCASLLPDSGSEERADAKPACGVCRARSDTHDAACLRGGARIGVRSALPRFSVCATHRRGRAISRASPGGRVAKRNASGGGNSRGQRARAFGDLHSVQRRLCQLAVALGVRDAGCAFFQSGSGARRARLRTNSPTASEDRPTL